MAFVDLLGSPTTMVDRRASVLWKLVKEYQIDDPNYPLMFSDRLAKEMMWSKEYTLRAIEEYKRFMFLAAVGTEGVTPSMEVDEVWHMHMLYTRDYKAFCNLLGKFIHHGPTRGDKKEDEMFVDWYGRTKDAYCAWFHEVPPIDIWPSTPVRFRNVHFVRVDLMTQWIFPAGDWKALCKCLWKYIKWKVKRLL